MLHEPVIIIDESIVKSPLFVENLKKAYKITEEKFKKITEYCCNHTCDECPIQKIYGITEQEGCHLALIVLNIDKMEKEIKENEEVID